MKTITNNEMNTGSALIWRCCIITMLILMCSGAVSAQRSDSPIKNENSEAKARVTGLRYINIHVLELEKTLKLYSQILGFKLSNAEVLHRPGLEGMLVLKIKANDLTISLSVPAPEFMHSLAPVGNTNHNHFMLTVNDIGPIGDKLKEEGYELENEHYVRDKYTFFEGPNGEIIGLSSW